MKVSFSSDMRASGIYKEVTGDSSFVNTAKNSGLFWYESPSKDFNLRVKTLLWEQAGSQSSEFLLSLEYQGKAWKPSHSFICSFSHLFIQKIFFDHLLCPRQGATF